MVEASLRVADDFRLVWRVDSLCALDLVVRCLCFEEVVSLLVVYLLEVAVDACLVYFRLRFTL